MAIALRALSMAEISAPAGLLVAVPQPPIGQRAPARRCHRSPAAPLKMKPLWRESFPGCSCCGHGGGQHLHLSWLHRRLPGGDRHWSRHAAGGAVWLTGFPEAVAHGRLLAIKTPPGLICDPPASPVGVGHPHKRNAMGFLVAMMAAEISRRHPAASCRRTIGPLPLKDILVERLPTELRGACVGGLVAAPYAKVLQAKWGKTGFLRSCRMQTRPEWPPCFVMRKMFCRSFTMGLVPDSSLSGSGTAEKSSRCQPAQTRCIQCVHDDRPGRQTAKATVSNWNNSNCRPVGGADDHQYQSDFYPAYFQLPFAGR